MSISCLGSPILNWEQEQQRRQKVIRDILIGLFKSKPLKCWKRAELVSALKKKKVFFEFPFRRAMVDLYLDGYVEHVYKNHILHYKWLKNHVYQGWP